MDRTYNGRYVLEGHSPATGHSWNWKGGRVVEPRGYVLIYVGKEHPLADCRGYAYEHRLKAQEKIDRPLLSKEHVHHDNENKSDNADGNLILTASLAEHFVHHRKRSDLRNPGEPNPAIECACGCKALFLKYDSEGRPRRFISGHNPPCYDVRDEFLACLRSDVKSLREIASITGQSTQAVRVMASKLSQAGVIKRVGHGRYSWVKEHA